MYDKFLSAKQLNVKVGDIVSVQGNRGIVTEVMKHNDVEWNGKEYVKVEGSEGTSVRVHFTGELAEWSQYQDGVYGDWAVIESRDYTPEYQDFFKEVASTACGTNVHELYGLYCKEPSWFEDIIEDLWTKNGIFNNIDESCLDYWTIKELRNR